MADGVPITAGSGTTILTDDTGAGGHAQVVKLAISTDGSGTLIPADGTNGMLVNLGANNDVTVTGTVTANLAAGTNNIGDVDVLSVPAPLSTTGGGTEATAQRVTIANDSTGVLSVDDNGGALTVDNGGTFAVQESGSALTALQLIDDPVFTDDAAYTVGTSKVMVSGGVAVAHGSAPDAADAGDAVAPLHNRHRVQFTIGGHPNIITRAVHIADADGAQTDATIVGTISAGTKVAVTAIAVTVDSATTNATAVKLGFGATTIPADSTTGANGVILDHDGIAPGSGIVVGNGSGLLGIGADGEELRLTCEDPVGGSLSVVFSYFLIES